MGTYKKLLHTQGYDATIVDNFVDQSGNVASNKWGLVYYKLQEKATNQDLNKRLSTLVTSTARIRLAQTLYLHSIEPEKIHELNWLIKQQMRQIQLVEPYHAARNSVKKLPVFCNGRLVKA